MLTRPQQTTTLRLVGMVRVGITALVLALGGGCASAPKATGPSPEAFLVGRRTFFDFGPPFEFYEIIAARGEGEGTRVERVTLTPQGDACRSGTTAEHVTAFVPVGVSSLLGSANPCSIPEGELRRERGRCRDCLMFSGADVVMQFQCGRETRRARMNVLDRDLFDGSSRPPRHTSWTLGVLGRLDAALGPGVTQPSAFLTTADSSAPLDAESALVADLARGGLDALFEGAPEKASRLLAESSVGRAPTVELATDSPFRPRRSQVRYPDLARMAQVQGSVGISLKVAAGGTATEIVVKGPPLLDQAVWEAAREWTFPLEAAGHVFTASLVFDLHCVRDPLRTREP